MLHIFCDTMKHQKNIAYIRCTDHRLSENILNIWRQVILQTISHLKTTKKKWSVNFNRESVLFVSILWENYTEYSQKDRFSIKFDRSFFCAVQPRENTQVLNILSEFTCLSSDESEFQKSTGLWRTHITLQLEFNTAIKLSGNFIDSLIIHSVIHCPLLK